MQFTLIHAVGNRVRYRAQQSMSIACARVIIQEASRIDGLTGVTLNPRTGSLIATAEDLSALQRLHQYLASLAHNPPILRVQKRSTIARIQEYKQHTPSIQQTFAQIQRVTPPVMTRAMVEMPVNRLYHRIATFFNPRHQTPQWSNLVEKGELDFAPLTRFFFLRPFMPIIINASNAILGSIPIIFEGIRDLLRGKMTVATLDASALLISLLRRDFRTAGLLVLLLGLGEMLESYTQKKSLQSLRDELALKVDQVWVENPDGSRQLKSLKDVTLDDYVVVQAGSIIPVDGIVVSGEGSVNQASMTGEPLPVVRKAGGAVFAGTSLAEGELVIRPTKIGENTSLQKIVQFISNSEAHKSNFQGLAEKWAERIVPFNFALAALVFLFTRDLIRTASVLMVDFSCALRLATPLSIMTSMRAGTQKGIIVKGGRYLERITKVDTVVFDKTGTLTQSTPVVSDVISFSEEYPEHEILRLSACLEEHFPHPVGRAIVKHAKEQDLCHIDELHNEVSYIVAHGICAVVNGSKVVLGSRHYIAEDRQVDVTIAQEALTRLTHQGKSVLYLAKDQKLIGLIAIEDPIRPEAKRVVQALRERGVKNIIMLTGDDERTAQTVAQQVGITQFQANVLPHEKGEFVQKLRRQGATVLMIGDGMNDSPALSVADIGVTHSEGADLAQAVSDIVLTGPNIAQLPLAFDLGHLTMRRVRQNTFGSIGLNGLYLAGGLVGFLSPAAGALLHNGTTIAVCLNAMRDPWNQSSMLQSLESNILHTVGQIREHILIEEEKCKTHNHLA